MKKASLLTLAALMGFALPVIAGPVVAPVDNAPVTSNDEAELEESSGWVFGGSVGLDFCSKQLTYGIVDNPHAILTPSAALSLGNDEYFTIEIGVEAIFDTTNYGAKDGGYNDRRYTYQEFDPSITLSRNWDTESWLGSTLDTAIGYTYEYHPRSCNKRSRGFENPDTQWLTFEVSAPDFWLVPTFAVEYQLVRQGAEGDGDGKGAIYATLAFSHDFDLSDCLGLEEETLMLTPTVGFGMGNRARNEADFGDWYADEDVKPDSFMLRDGFASLELAYTPFEGFSIAPYIGCHQQLDSHGKDATGDDDFVAYAGIGLSYEF